jgi:alanyl-tRNA synthetase
LKSEEIRNTFINFFEERDHRVVPSSSLVPDDPTLLLTNAGMVQFKPYFLGERKAAFSRATTVQKCLRTTDIESVGITARHNTFFEMLGNFSFGDYYKESVIPWAWELITKVYDIDPASLWMSVYEEDDEAEQIWKSTPGVDPARVIRLGADDNFWDMGATGPCGPCSEILFDRGADLACGPTCEAGCDCDRFLELWNLVFMQYDRRADESLVPLPRKNIDTGMGLERVAALKQGVRTIFETDIIRPVIDSIADLSGMKLGDGHASDISIKVLADHSRAATFLISDGVIPSNEGRGYILRRLLRRAVRHGRLLGIEGHFIDGLSSVVVELLGGVYPGLKEHYRLVEEVISSEEERFSQTLEQGLALLKDVVEKGQAEGKETIDGKTVFYLHDTLGFPFEVTREIAGDAGMGVDEEGFDELMEEQRERARRSREGEAVAEELGVFTEVCEVVGETTLEAHSCSTLDSRVTALIVDGARVDAASDRESVEVVLDSTPFYAEAGGQLGDTGIITTPDGTLTVLDTYYGTRGLAVHKGKLEGTVKEGDPAHCEVDAFRRQAISRNHSATHLLHYALRRVLGTHARQAGSLVGPDRLRFDFTHFKALSPDELLEIEAIANDRVLEDWPVDTTVKSRDEAEASGAMALFGEKYGERVRVVQMGDFSMELCGGIHVASSGQIGPIRIISESGIGAGLRRIEATSGHATLEHFRFVQDRLDNVATLLKARPEEVPERVGEMAAKLRELERDAARERSGDMVSSAEAIAESGRKVTIDDVTLVTQLVDGADGKTLRDMADIVMAKSHASVVALASSSNDKASLVVKIEKGLVSRGLDAKQLANAGGKALGGGGGGRPDMAVAGGSRLDGLSEALEIVEKATREKLGQ